MPINRRRVIVSYNDDGTPVYKQIQAANEAALNDRTVQVYIESGRIREFLSSPSAIPEKPKEKTLFRTYAENWMAVYKKPKLKPRTYQGYHSYMQAHLEPTFGDRFIEDITIADVQKFLNERSGHSRKSLKEYLNLLRQVFDAAIEDKLITENPASSKRLVNPSDRVKQRTALTTAQMREILSHLYKLEDGSEKLLLALFIFTGMRRGEALGLKWEDIDFEKRLIHVRRNVTHPQNAPVIGTPKTKNGFRDIPFGEHLEAILVSMKSNGFLFGGETPISVHSYDTLMRHITSQIDLYGATAHVLRHTYLTMLAAENVDLKTLQTIAGHANSQTTMNIYVHPKVENIMAAGEKMDGILHEYAAKTNNIAPVVN